MRFAVPVLTYHAVNIAGNEYATNDHVAFAEDLELLASLGCRIVPAERVAAAVSEGRPLEGDKLVALTLDDGTDFDFRDLDHPQWGPQRSMFGIAGDHRARRAGAHGDVHVTSFVIVSREARIELDRTCLVGRGWWTDGWWTDAVASGRWAIANHSLDHNHPALLHCAAGDAARGSFLGISDFDAAEAEIAEAAAMLRDRAPNPGASLFAYPYGDASDYLVREYFPAHHRRIGVAAAFGTGAAPVTEASDRWQLPRYVCGDHWRSPGELEKLLGDAFS
jgi:peptidoglycan/xylan/chitin deacetylase (PgdA/CDA1 family)